MSNEWKLVRLGDCATFINGKAFKPSEWNNDGLPIIRIQNLTGNNTETNYYKGNIDEKYKIYNGDILISWSATLGVFIWNKGNAVLNQHIFKVVFDKLVFDKQYFYYLISNSIFSMSQQVHGATMKHITKDKFDNLEVKYFPLFRQKEIAGILDKASELIEKRREQLRELDSLAESVFQDMFGDPVMNEKGWEKRPIEKLVIKDKNAIKAGPFGSSLKKESYTESGYKIYGQEQVLSGNCNYGNYFVSEEKYNELSSCKVGYDDVLISLVGSYGKTLVIPKDFQEGIINPRLMKISFDQAQISPMFFCFIFGMDVFQMYLANITHGGTMPILNVGTVKKIGIALPPLFLQQQFAAIIEKIEEQKAKVKEALKESEDLFQRLMQDLFNPDQD